MPDMCSDCGDHPWAYKKLQLCRQCHNRRWRQANPERYAAQRKRHRQRHKEEIAEYQRQWTAKHVLSERERKQRWQEKNRERSRETKRRWAQAHPDKARASARRWQRANPEKMRAAVRRYTQRYPEQVRARGKAWREANPEKRRQRWRDWCARNPERLRELLARRRARRRGAFVENVDPREIYERDKGLCGICHRHVASKKMSLDHIVPLSRGGEHSRRNVQLAHLRCNESRGAGRLPGQLRFD